MIETYRTIHGLYAFKTEKGLYNGDLKPTSIMIRMEERNGQMSDIEVDAEQAEGLKIGQRVKITIEVVER